MATELELGQVGPLLSAISKCGALKGIKFCYALAKNTKKLLPEYKTFEEQRVQLCKDMCLKDENDKPIMKDVPGGKPGFDFEDEDAFNEEFDKLLETKIEIDLHLIAMDDVPEDITVAQLNGIFPMIREPMAVAKPKETEKPQQE